MALNKRQRTLRDLIWKTAGYTPSPEQWAIHQDDHRFKLIAGGVGAGKSYFTAMEIVAYSAVEGGVGWIIGPKYELARPEFDYIFEVFQELELIAGQPSRPTQGQCSFTTPWGFRWLTKTSDDPTALAGIRPHVLAVTEAAQHDSSIVNKMFERSAQNRAPVIFSGTFEGAYGWYADLWNRWQGPNDDGGKSFSLPTWTNRAVYPGGREDPEIKRQESLMPPDLFQERFGGIPCKPSGLVFKEFERDIHIAPQDELFDPELPVEIWMDPATHCYPVLFVQIQKDGETVHVLDEIYSKNELGAQVIQKVVKTPWWKHSCLTGVMDAAGNYRFGANNSQVEVWNETLRALKEHPISFRSTVLHDVNVWYQQIHLRLHVQEDGKPRLMFAQHLNDTLSPDGRANGIIGELRSHRWPEDNEHKGLATRPIKRNEDALSALGYGLVAHFGPVMKRTNTYRRTNRYYV